jgi:choline dehydrogenase
MGVGSFSVVDNKDCTHGMDRLRITGASIMPSITDRNLNAPSIMVPQKTRK